MKINKINSTVYIQVLNTAVFSLSIVKVKYVVKKSLKQKIKLVWSTVSCLVDFNNVFQY